MPKTVKTALREAANSCFQGFNIQLVDYTTNIYNVTNFTNKNALRYDIQLTPTAKLLIQVTKENHLNIRLDDDSNVLYSECFVAPKYTNALLYFTEIAALINDSYYIGMDINEFSKGLKNRIIFCAPWWIGNYK